MIRPALALLPDAMPHLWSRACRMARTTEKGETSSAQRVRLPPVPPRHRRVAWSEASPRREQAASAAWIAPSARRMPHYLLPREGAWRVTMKPMTYEHALGMMRAMGHESDLRHLAMAAMTALAERRAKGSQSNNEDHAPFVYNRAKRAIDEAWVSGDGK